MISINILGLKNYRVFDDKDGVLEELSNINILTGANNSGKSSIIKFFQLLKNSQGKFPFELDLTEQQHL
ncbi:AAA family ATPase, partial [Tenacibaculum maritimum]